MLNYYLGVRDSFVSAPDDYDIEKVKELEKTYGSDSSGSGSEKTADDADSSDAGADGSQITSTLDSGKKPVIITIMGESFADLSTVGEFETNQEATGVRRQDAEFRMGVHDRKFHGLASFRICGL